MNAFSECSEHGRHHDDKKRDSCPIGEPLVFKELFLGVLINRNEMDQQKGEGCHDRAKETEVENALEVPLKEGLLVDVPDLRESGTDVEGHSSCEVAECREHRVRCTLGAHWAKTQVHDAHWEKLVCRYVSGLRGRGGGRGGAGVR